VDLHRTAEEYRVTRLSYEGWEPPHLSYSTVSGYRDCGMRTKLQKVLKIEQRPGLAACGGNAVHTATELYDQGEGTDTAELFKQGWAAAVEKNKEWSPSYGVEDYTVTGRAPAAYGGKQNLQWWMDNGPGMVQNWIDWREKNGWEIWETPEGVPAVELELNIVLPNGYPVKTFLDRVMVTPAGQITIVDIKSGRSPETQEQLGLYATAMELIYGQMFRPAWGYFWDARKGEHSSPMLLDAYTPQYFAEVYEEAVRGMNAGCFLAKPANNCFNWCGVRDACPAFHASR
jgi:putative RecB family exonuclease